MAASLSGVWNVQEFSDSGAPLVGGRLYTYVQGTTTFKSAYTEATGTTPHTYTSDGLGGQYIALNARGELPAPLYLTTGSYDLALKRADGSAIWTRRADPVGDSQQGVTGVIGISAQGVSINAGDSSITPDDLAAALGPSGSSTSGALSLPYIGSAGASDAFLITQQGGGSGTAIQGRIAVSGVNKVAGVLGYYNGASSSAVYATNFAAGYYAYTCDGPSVFRATATDTLLVTTETGSTSTAVQGRINTAGVSQGAGVLGYAAGVSSCVWAQSNAAGVYAIYVSAGKSSLNNTGGGDAFFSTNTGIGTALKGTQNAGAVGSLGFYDGTISAAVHGYDGGSASNYAAYFSGKGFVGSAWTVSDARLKRNIIPAAPNALERIKKLEIVEYDKLAIPTADSPEDRVLCREVGFVAQQLEPLIPSAVHDDGAWLTVNDRSVLATLIQAVQELSAEVAALRAAP